MVMSRIKRALKRARYAAIGAAIGAGVGGLLGRNAASTGGATGALAGAILADIRYSEGGVTDRIRPGESEADSSPLEDAETSVEGLRSHLPSK